jgi:hypothetical protein
VTKQAVHLAPPTVVQVQFLAMYVLYMLYKAIPVQVQVEDVPVQAPRHENIWDSGDTAP